MAVLLLQITLLPFLYLILFPGVHVPIIDLPFPPYEDTAAAVVLVSFFRPFCRRLLDILSFEVSLVSSLFSFFPRRTAIMPGLFFFRRWSTFQYLDEPFSLLFEVVLACSYAAELFLPSWTADQDSSFFTTRQWLFSFSAFLSPPPASGPGFLEQNSRRTVVPFF